MSNGHFNEDMNYENTEELDRQAQHLQSVQQDLGMYDTCLYLLYV